MSKAQPQTTKQGSADFSVSGFVGEKLINVAKLVITEFRPDDGILK